MRIIAGKYRRRRLLTNPGVVTRPITDRVKETLFERMGDFVKDRKVADIFAGTGTLGLESLSRGAKSVVFLENDTQAYKLLRENAEKLGVLPDVFCWRTDILRCSFRPQKLDHLLPFEVIFMDPPYRMVPDIVPRTMFYKTFERLARPDVSAPDVTMILRCPEKTEFELPPAWEIETVWRMSGMDLHIVVRSGTATDPESVEQAADEATINADSESPLPPGEG